MRRRLAADHPATFNPALAKSLHNLSPHLSDLGRREEALQTIEEAVGLHRSLAAERPAAFNSHLASSLTSLSYCFSDLGCRDAALQAIEEAVALWRQLAAEYPGAFNSDLAISYHNLSGFLSDVGRKGDALLAIYEQSSGNNGLQLTSLLYSTTVSQIPSTASPGVFLTWVTKMKLCTPWRKLLGLLDTSR